MLKMFTILRLLPTPHIVLAKTEWNIIRAISLVQELHASKWQNAADFAAKVIQVFSEDIGMYEYNKIIVADARDGMEYPMITLDGGSDPGYKRASSTRDSHSVVLCYGRFQRNIQSSTR